MSEAAPPVAAPVAAAPQAGAPSNRPPAPSTATGPLGSEPQRVIELKVSGHLMTLDTGMFCVFQPPGAPAAGRTGLPGVRISLPPAGREGAVQITTFRADGWLAGGDGAALVRVAQGPAQILVTIYQAPDAPAELAPRLQVMRLTAEPAPVAPTRPVAPPAGPEIIAHLQRTGDVGAALNDWMGVRGSKLWIEGFAVAPRTPLPGTASECLEYQAVLGRDWLSPWVEGGGYCGSRGMALPLLGLAVRLKGPATATHELALTATFVDGTMIGPLPGGRVAQADSLAPLEAFRIELRPRGAGPARAAPVACGIGCGGPMELGMGIVSPLNIPAWRAFPLRDRVADHTGLSVAVDNDAKALALGEGWTGAAAGRSDFLAMVVSTGIGAGIVLDGRLLSGRLGNAGHLGHVVVEPAGRPCACGGRGCLEAEASGTAIAQMTGAPPAEAPEHVRRRVGMLVGRAVADAANLLDLDLAVVAGSVALGFGSAFLESARQELQRRSRLDFSRSTRIVFAPAGPDAPLMGAAALAWGIAPEAV